MLNSRNYHQRAIGQRGGRGGHGGGRGGHGGGRGGGPRGGRGGPGGGWQITPRDGLHLHLHGGRGRRRAWSPGNWWWWWYGGGWPYYPWPTYATRYQQQKCCVELDSGTIFCNGDAYPGEILEVSDSGRHAHVAHEYGSEWYEVC